MAKTNLSELELLQIAKEVQETPENEKTLTDYLTEEEKEAVKAMVKSLRASAQAMRVYVVKTQYLDSLRAQEEKKVQLDRKTVAAISRMENYLNDWLLPYATALQRSSANLMRLEGEQLSAARFLILSIDKDAEAISRAVLKSGSPLVPLSDIKTANALIEMNRYMLNEGIANSQSSSNLKEAKALRRSALDALEKAGGHGLRMTVREYIKAFDSHTMFLQRTFGALSEDARSALRRRVDIRGREVYGMQKDVVALRGEHAAASERTEALKEETIRLAGWYILAAVGDVLVELGQNLAY